MTRILRFTIVLFNIIFFLSAAGCQSFVWDPTGIWSVTYGKWTEDLNFQGNPDLGLVTGWTSQGDHTPRTGTWEKTADFTIELNFVFTSVYGSANLEIQFTSSRDNPNFMSGKAYFEENGYTENFELTATKSTNLQ